MQDLSKYRMDLPRGTSLTGGFNPVQSAIDDMSRIYSPYESYERQILDLKASLKDKEDQIKYLEEMIDELEKNEL